MNCKLVSSRVAAVLAGGIALCGASCAIRSPTPEPSTSEHQAIVQGDHDFSNPFSDVVVRLDSGCSGTLISPRLVLTAAHCIPSFDQPTNIYIGDQQSSGNTRGVQARWRRVDFGYEFNTLSPGQDLGVVALDK